jgi:hypothetical protein
MIYIQLAAWVLFVLFGLICVINFYTSFLRYPIYIWRGMPKESFKFISGIPIFGSLIVYFLLRHLDMPPAMQYVAIILIVIDTGGIHWAIGNITYHSFKALLNRMRRKDKDGSR